VDRFFARNRLSALVDGDLPAAEAREVERAIARNPDLAAEHAALTLTQKLMKTQGAVPAPRGFHARVMTQLATEPPTGSQVAFLRARLNRIPLEAKVLAAAAIIIGIVIHQRQSPEAPQLAMAPTQSPEATSAPRLAKKAKKAARVAKAKASSTTTEPAVRETNSGLVPVSGATTPLPSADLFGGKVGYRFLGRGDEVLFKIGTLADEIGGRLVDDSGSTYRPHSLSEIRNFVRAYLVFPTDQSSAVHRRLQRQSGQAPHEITGAIPTVLPDESVVLIAVQR
jgi:negative regulator of sigma E activity